MSNETLIVTEENNLETGVVVETDNKLAEVEAMLDNRIVRAIHDMGFTKLSPIQEQAIPYLLEGKDIIGQAQTGTGKTAAFGIPLIQKINPDLRKLQAIVLCPTRELAIQAAEELRKLAKYIQGVKILPVYGGQDIGRQISGLRGVQIVVGTPGRVMDHMRRHTIKLGDVNMVVLDEADEMLNMGFREDMELILGEIPGEHQTALFSATMPKPILEITGKFQKDAELVKVAAKELTIPLVMQRYFRIRHEDKNAAMLRLLEYYQPNLCLIFCNTKKMVDDLAGLLKAEGFQAEGLHGDLTQYQRDIAMNQFRSGVTHILVATDVAARGIDVDDVEIVLNYDIPQDIEYYVHRIGRTGRAGKKGCSFTFVSGKEIYKLREIERVCHTTIEEFKLPSAAKAMRVKAEKALDKVLVNHENTDYALMKKFIERKMAECECDALEIAAAFLKDAVGEMGEDIVEDDFRVSRPGRRERNGGLDRKEFGDRKQRFNRRDKKSGFGKKDYSDKKERLEKKDYSDKKENLEKKERSDKKEHSEKKGLFEKKSRFAKKEVPEKRERKIDVRRDGSEYRKKDSKKHKKNNP